MSEKLVGIKIKNSNNTYSEEIPISALASNIVWDSTHSLVDVLGNINVSAGSIQSQINSLLNDKVSLSQLNSYIETEISDDVENWLDHNVNIPESGILIDNSLTISGQAADAKKTGDEIGDLKSAINDIIVISDTEPSLEDNKIWINSAADSVQVPTMEDFLGVLPDGSATGAFVTITDGAKNMPVDIQFGEQATNVIRCGANLFPKIPSATIHGVTITVDANGVIDLDGLCDANTVYGTRMYLKAGTYSIADFAFGTFPINSSARTQVNPIGNIPLYTKNDNATSYLTATITESGDAEFRIRLQKDFDYDHCKLYPMLVVGVTQPTSFVPFKGETYNITNGELDRSLKTLYGDNIIWSDVGDITVSYKKDIDLMIESLFS